MTRRVFPRPLPVRAFRRGLTLVEMLVAMAITLLIMAAVVTVFANVTSSVTRRRATIEMSSALRNVREVLARDLAGATCPAVPWQRPEANHGYLEIIEGPQNDYYPTPWIFDGDGDGRADPIGGVDGIDLSVSSLPGSNLGAAPTADEEGSGLSVGSNTLLDEQTIPTDGRGLGDADDTLMLTVRNENEPFVGRIPATGGNTPANSGFPTWGFDEVESQLAEVVWFAVENPVDPNRTFGFGEPGYRTIYRRALLILPDLDYGINVTAGGMTPNSSDQTIAAGPGVVRVLPAGLARDQVAAALAGLIAFQERYDLSVRLDWDTNLPGSDNGRWVLRANSLADLTKRENRYEHHGFVPQPQTIAIRQGTVGPAADRYFPFAANSGGVHSGSSTLNLSFVADPELGVGTPATQFRAITAPLPVTSNNNATTVVAFNRLSGGAPGAYFNRPLAVINDSTDRPGTARAILNEDGAIVHVTSGLAPLGGSRRGDDIMITNALAFDLRVYDPGAPIYSYFLGGNSVDQPADQIVSPGDIAWLNAFYRDGLNNVIADGIPAISSANPFRFERQGAYVDMAYGLSYLRPNLDPATIQPEARFRTFNLINDPQATWDNASQRGLNQSLFFFDGLIRTATGPVNVRPDVLTRRYASYDTWSTHYESNGVNEDGDLGFNSDPSLEEGDIVTAAGQVLAFDEGVNGLDDPTTYNGTLATRFGPDDDAERETRPPYDTALRGMQASLRVYERDSRQIREVRVRESFIPE